MEILDSQVHALHDIPVRLRDQPEEVTHLVGAYALVAALDAVGVDGALVNWTPEFHEVLYRSFPDRIRTFAAFEPRGAVAMGIVRASVPDFPETLILSYDGRSHLEEMVRDQRERCGTVALRLEPGMLLGDQWRRNAELFGTGGYDDALDLAAELGMPVCLLIAGALEHVDRAAREFPETTLVIDHLGLLPPIASFAEPERELAMLLDLAQHPNVLVKISGLVPWSQGAFPFRDQWPLIGKVIRSYGPERVMWGSDFTIHQQRRTYAETARFLFESDLLDDAGQQLFFAGNVRRVFNWPVPENVQRPTSLS